MKSFVRKQNEVLFVENMKGLLYMLMLERPVVGVCWRGRA